jgi:hypothetical protein
MNQKTAHSYGVDLAIATVEPQALRNLATYGYKGVTGFEDNAYLDFECRNAAQDHAKTICE